MKLDGEWLNFEECLAEAERANAVLLGTIDLLRQVADEPDPEPEARFEQAVVIPFR